MSFSCCSSLSQRAVRTLPARNVSFVVISTISVILKQDCQRAHVTNGISQPHRVALLNRHELMITWTKMSKCKSSRHKSRSPKNSQRRKRVASHQGRARKEASGEKSPIPFERPWKSIAWLARQRARASLLITIFSCWDMSGSAILLQILLFAFYFDGIWEFSASSSQVYNAFIRSEIHG